MNIVQQFAHDIVELAQVNPSIQLLPVRRLDFQRACILRFRIGSI